MNTRKLFYFFFFNSLVCLSLNINNLNDSVLKYENYKWIINNKSEYLSVNKKELHKNEIDSILYRIATKLENSGYPFAIIEFRHDSIKNNNIYGKVIVDKRRLVKIDSIAIKGYDKFPKYLINRFLNIKINEEYKKDKIDKISKKILNNNFTQEYKKNTILFNKKTTILFLYLEKKYNNYMEGFLGLNNNQEESSIYGKININLSNTLNKWESINIKWNKITENSQELSLNFEFPFIFNSIFLLNSKFNILQYNNSYVNKEFISSLELNKKNNFLKIGYIHNRSNIINNQNNLIKEYKTNLLMFNWSNKKNSLFRKKIDYRISKEYRIGVNQTTNEKNIRHQINLNLKLKIPFFVNSYFYLNSNNKYLTGNKILENEKIGVGGINQIRGYIENSFFSNSFSIINLENKYFFNNKSYFSFFYDFGKLYDINTQLESFGLGIGIDMINDIFLINYAIPKYNEKIEFNNSKIHFNYILKF